MFNLENAIQSWKRLLRGSPAFEEGQIKEMETHLRDEIDELTASGLTEEEAFQRTVDKFGPIEVLEDEVYKTKASGPGATPPWKQKAWIPSLLPNYLKVALRTFRRQSGYTAINVLGLAMGLACCLLIALFVTLEVSYDRFHTKHDRIYRVVTDITQGGQTRELAWSPPPLAQALTDDLPDVESAVRIFRQSGVVRYGEEQTTVNVNFVDSTFFEIFDYELAGGDPASALQTPGGVVLTADQAELLFGEEDPMGKSLTFQDDIQLEVRDVLAEIPPNTHFYPQYLVNIGTLPGDRFRQWGAMNLWTYLLLGEEAGAEQLQEKLPDFIESRLGAGWAELMTLHLQPLPSIYFESDRLPEIGPTGSPEYALIFSGIGVFLLLIACINFTNLSTAQSLQRAREVGVRKVLGVSRGQLMLQFLGESVLLSLLAMGLALALASWALPVFSELSGYELIAAMLFQPELLLALISSALMVGVLSGSYPALVLSRFRPSAVLRGSAAGVPGQGRGAGGMFRRGLVALQFAVTIFLLAGTWVIGRQLSYMQNKDLGFDKEQLAVLRLENSMRGNYGPLVEQLRQHSAVVSVAVSSQVPGVPFSLRGYVTERMTQGEVLTNTLWIDDRYLASMGMDLVAGRGYAADRPADLQNGFLINESALSHFGWSSPQEALGGTIGAPEAEGQEVEGTVIGVVEDFHYASLHNTIQPLVMRYRQQQNFLSVRLAGGRLEEGMDHIEEVWSSVAPDTPLVSWFMDEQLQNQYQAEQRMGELFTWFSGLTIFIACMGLFGLASFTLRRRSKEIGIRKILGASLGRIFGMLTKEYLGLVLLANLIALPAAWYLMQGWLENFAYRAVPEWWIYAGAGLSVMLVALLTVSWHSFRTARLQPVESLRSE